MALNKTERRQRIHYRIRKHVNGTAERPRMVVFRSNKYIYVLKREYSKLSRDAHTDSYPIDYFIGFNIYRDDRELGTITDIEDSTANVLFKITASDGSHQYFLPAVEEFIVDIDMDKKKLYMDFPEELMHL